MEFEELQKIWLSEKQETVYAINEEALQRRVHAKKNKILHIANLSEWIGMIANLGSGGLILGLNIGRNSSQVILCILGGWMLLSSVYVLISRLRRLQATPKFDRSMQEELQHAVQTATYQVRLSRFMRLNTIPIGLLCVIGILNSKHLLWLAGILSLFFIAMFYLSGWEHGIYKRKKRELEQLYEKLS